MGSRRRWLSTAEDIAPERVRDRTRTYIYMHLYSRTIRTVRVILLFQLLYFPLNPMAAETEMG